MDVRLELSHIVSSLQKRIDNLRTVVKAEERVVIALAGVPGSGKSTISGALVQQLHNEGFDDVVAVPMDGFHLTKVELLKLGGPQEAMSRRGAPFTFNANAFVSAAEILRHSPVTRTDSKTPSFKVPSFDHAVQDPIKDDIEIPTWVKVVILEGNYTLLDLSPWNQIADLAHEKWYVDTPRDVAKDRITLRHLSTGIESVRVEAEARAEMNDLKNGDLITDNLISPDVRIQY